MISRKVAADILADYNLDRTLQLLQKMIEIPSHKQVEWQEDRLAKFIASYLEDSGLKDIELDYIEENRPNIKAIIPGAGSGSSLLLNGHTDTIPPYNMVIPPYKPEVRGDHIFGRGAVDMKGSIAAMLTAMRLIQLSGYQLAGDLVFSGVIDQEQRSLGTVKLVEDGLDVDYAIVGEPTDLQICRAHKGMEWYRIIIKGKSAHGSTPEKGLNTIYQGSRIVREIEKLNLILQQREDSLVSHPTINVGMISGGDDPNIVPNVCHLDVDRRYTTRESRKEIYEEIERLLARVNAAAPGFSTEVIPLEDKVCPLRNRPLAGPEENSLIAALKNSLKSYTDRDQQVTFFRGWSDAALLHDRLGIPSVVFGPGLPEKCHSGDESLKIADLYSAVKIYLEVILEICGVC